METFHSLGFSLQHTRIKDTVVQLLQCEHFVQECEWLFPGDLAQEHVFIYLPKDLCRDVKKNQKQKICGGGAYDTDH